MTDNGIQRKLKAIFSADVKGFSLLMGDDDESTVTTITTYREIITDLIQKHQGRVVDSPGDNILAEFSSVLNAVNGAIDIQQSLEIENANFASRTNCYLWTPRPFLFVSISSHGPHFVEPKEVSRYMSCSIMTTICHPLL